MSNKKQSHDVVGGGLSWEKEAQMIYRARFSIASSSPG
jgi:hypothetical protein